MHSNCRLCIFVNSLLHDPNHPAMPTLATPIAMLGYPERYPSEKVSSSLAATLCCEETLEKRGGPVHKDQVGNLTCSHGWTGCHESANT